MPPRKKGDAPTAPTRPPGARAAAAINKRKAADDDGDDAQASAPKAKRARSTPAPARKTAATSKSAKAKPTKATKTATTKTSVRKSQTSAPSKPKSATAAKPRAAVAPKPAKPVKKLPVINHAPTKELDVFVCGEGGNGELGLGTSRKAVDVKRPRINHFLNENGIRVVHAATGGMHCAVLTADNKILTWGVNDDGALGRGKTDGDAKLVDMNKQVNGKADDSDSDDEDDNGLNPSECVPREIPAGSFPDGTVITQLAAGDSITLALTAQGLVYGWGIFRDNNGKFGFSPNAQLREAQYHPVLIEGLSNVVQVACGDNHCLALTAKGELFTWGAYEASQLGRRVVQRHTVEALKPTQILRRHKIKAIGSGSFHSFAVDDKDRVYAWGLNNSGQTGIAEHAGEDSASVQPPQLVKALAGHSITQIKGGQGHTIALDATGKVLVWGKADGGQLGIDLDAVAQANRLQDSRGATAVVTRPQQVPNIEGAHVTSGTDHCIALTTAGKAYSWGMSANYQTGQGTCDDDDTAVAALVDNTAVRERRLVWAGAGGQYSAFAATRQ